MAIEVRPHFEHRFSIDRDEAARRINDAINLPDFRWEADSRGYHFQIGVPKPDRHAWSPWLTFDVEADDTGCRLLGCFMPHPSMWTLYMAGYGVAGFSALGLAGFGFSQWMAGLYPWAFWPLPGCGLLLMALVVMPFVGQEKTQDQMKAIASTVLALFEDVSR